MTHPWNNGIINNYEWIMNLQFIKANFSLTSHVLLTEVECNPLWSREELLWCRRCFLLLVIEPAGGKITFWDKNRGLGLNKARAFLSMLTLSQWEVTLIVLVWLSEPRMLKKTKMRLHPVFSEPLSLGFRLLRLCCCAAFLAQLLLCVHLY